MVAHPSRWALLRVEVSYGFPNLEKGEFIYFMEKHVEYEFEAFKDIFERFDEDGNGTLDADELCVFLSSLGFTPLRSIIRESLDLVDLDSARGGRGSEIRMTAVAIALAAELLQGLQSPFFRGSICGVLSLVNARLFRMWKKTSRGGWTILNISQPLRAWQINRSCGLVWICQQIFGAGKL
eukprot:Skav215612  [mRNA]  locus=scaffold666:553883:555244:- [translate_table: standard]